MTAQQMKPVIISGAGLVGLTLAQSLQRDGIPFEIYERDSGLFSRYGGWAISLHWIIPVLQTCLTPDTFARLMELHNDPESLKAKEGVPYRYINLETGMPKFEDWGPAHLRVPRLKLRELLAEGIKINWNLSVVGWKPHADGVAVSLSDGTMVEGSLLAAAEGKNSKIRTQLLGAEKAQLHNLPLDLVGLKIRLPPDRAAFFRNVSPIFWHGAHPETQRFLFFSTISTPAVNGSANTDNAFYEVQLNMSWVKDATKPPLLASDDEKRRIIKMAAMEGSGFWKELRHAIEAIPDDAVEVLDVKMQDWPSVSWPSAHGKATLLGDALHPMTMYRGEAANHGMFDAVQLSSKLRQHARGLKTLEQAIQEYEIEAVERGNQAVLLSRHAGMDSHFYHDIDHNSALFDRTSWWHNSESVLQMIK